ncbi:MAG: VOC family protein [Povalibacter sp.]
MNSTTASHVIPCVSYRDASAAIDWLCTVFSFHKHVAYPSEDGGIAHAELKHGTGMIMVGSFKNTEYGQTLRSPNQVGGFVTQSVYVITSEPDELYAKAKRAGARIVVELRDESYGSRGFTCADLEGHIWSFGTYNPWAA